MTQHTPGPWFAHNIGLGPNGEGPFTYPLGNDPDKAAANARLIAAAPDMLAALEKVYEFIRREYVCLDPEEGRYIDKVAEPIWAILCEAIAKAKGGAA